MGHDNNYEMDDLSTGSSEHQDHSTFGRPSHNASSASSPPSVTTDNSHTGLIKKPSQVSGTPTSPRLKVAGTRDRHERDTVRGEVGEDTQNAGGWVGQLKESYPPQIDDVDLGATDEALPPQSEQVDQAIVEDTARSSGEIESSSQSSTVETPDNASFARSEVSITQPQSTPAQPAVLSTQMQQSFDSSSQSTISANPDHLEAGIEHTNQHGTTPAQRQGNPAGPQMKNALQVGTVTALFAAGTGIGAGFTINTLTGLPALILGAGTVVVGSLTAVGMKLALLRPCYIWAAMSGWAMLAAVEGMLIYHTRHPAPPLPPPVGWLD